MASRLASYWLPLLPRPVNRLPFTPTTGPRASFSTSLSLRLPRQTETRRAVTAQLPVLTLQEASQPVSLASRISQLLMAQTAASSAQRIRYFLSESVWPNGLSTFFPALGHWRILGFGLVSITCAAFAYWEADGLEERCISSKIGPVVDAEQLPASRCLLRGATQR